MAADGCTVLFNGEGCGTRATVARRPRSSSRPSAKASRLVSPFRRDLGAPDMPMGDFVRLFGPNGAFDQFFNQNLRGIVDARQKPWRPLTVTACGARIGGRHCAVPARCRDPRRLLPRAAAGTGGRLATVRAGPSLARCRRQRRRARGRRNENRHSRRHCDQRTRHRGVMAVAGRYQPQLRRGTAQSAIVSDGPWAALRLVARGRLQPTNVPDRLRLTLQQGVRTAEFELRTGSIVHPFTLRELAEFRCPQLSP